MKAHNGLTNVGGGWYDGVPGVKHSDSLDALVNINRRGGVGRTETWEG